MQTKTKRELQKLLSPHFKLSEVSCCLGGNEYVPYPVEQWRDRLSHLLSVAEAARAHFGPLIVNSAYRTPEHNRSIGGKPRSQHKEGRALDLTLPGRGTPDGKARIAELHDWFVAHADELMLGGIGKYRTFVHVDIRPRVRAKVIARW